MRNVNTYLSYAIKWLFSVFIEQCAIIYNKERIFLDVLDRLSVTESGQTSPIFLFDLAVAHQKALT